MTESRERAIHEAPQELQDGIREFWPEDEWDNAARIALLESGWSAFAEFNSTGPGAGCGAVLGERDGVLITAERSIGWFQVNACNLPSDWNPAHLFNTRHNCGTAHKLWKDAGGWYPWYFSARQLALI